MRDTDWYTLFAAPVLADRALDRVVNASHRVVMDGPHPATQAGIGGPCHRRGGNIHHVAKRPSHGDGAIP